MSKFRKKPVVIEAVQFVSGKPGVVTDFLGASGQNLKWQRVWDGGVDLIEIHIHTLEGEMIARPGDWIIRGVKGEYYPCKPDIFEQTYEPVEEATP